MSSFKSTLERNAEQSAFDELCERVAAGREVPSLGDLLAGCPFYKDEIWADADAVARRATDQLCALNDGNTDLLFALAELTVAPGVPDFVHAAEQLQAVAGTQVGDAVSAELAVARCHFYAAVSGRPESARSLADYLASPAGRRTVVDDRAARAWAMAGNGGLKPPNGWTR